MVPLVTATRCQMIATSRADHLAQLYTGFSMLDRAGEIELSQRVHCIELNRPDQPAHLRSARQQHLQVIVNDDVRVLFDMHDSWEIDQDAAERADFYFKRSYAPEKIPLAMRARVFPFGLNYVVYPDHFDRFEVHRSVGLRRGTSVLQGVAASTAAQLRLTRGRFRPYLSKMTARPDPTVEPRVIFMARAWDPVEGGDRSPEKVEQRIRINDVRAACIAQLRRAFGTRFFGGLQPTEYARSQYPSALVDDPRLCEQGRYVELLRQFPICVATTGLHDSIGFKLPEYVAFSKAIVSERLNYVVPGGFCEGRNYLEFGTADECVEAVGRLFESSSLREALMENNWRYYADFGRPDALVRRALRIVFAEHEGDDAEWLATERQSTSMNAALKHRAGSIARLQPGSGNNSRLR
jgi:hypothetical protein